VECVGGFWYSCPTRASGPNDCTAIKAERTRNGQPPATITATVPADSVGKYISIIIGAGNESNDTASASGPDNDEPLVWPALATGGRPTFPAAPAPGAQATIALKAWNLAAGTTFASRTVQVWS
jgi:hypothetical protein